MMAFTRQIRVSRDEKPRRWLLLWIQGTVGEKRSGGDKLPLLSMVMSSSLSVSSSSSMSLLMEGKDESKGKGKQGGE